ncbi:MAG: potassium transporter TrkG, partial [bacterium]
MKTGTVFHILGRLLLFLSATFLLPIPFSIYFHDGQVIVFLQSALITAIVGGILSWMFVSKDELSHRDGFAVVTFGWLGFVLFGALPFYISGIIPSFVNCLFESMSGFTCTGSTILETVEILSPSLIFWRSMTHWLGGMGIIVLYIAILPMLGIGGMQLFKAEVPGPIKDRLTPRIANTARILWGIYTLMTFLETILLMLAGMTFFDAI